MVVDKHLFIIMYHVTTRENHVILSVHVFNRSIFAKSFVSVQVTVENVSLDAAARVNVTQNNVPVF